MGKPSLPPLSALLLSTPYPGKLPSFDSLDWTTSPSRRHSHRSADREESREDPEPQLKRLASELNTSPTSRPPVLSQAPSSYPFKTSLNIPAQVSTTSHTTSSSAAKTKPPSAQGSNSPTQKSPTTRAFAFISHSPATYPSQEPSIDNAPLARRKRRRTSPHELAILNKEFMAGSTPNKLRRIEIALAVSMSEKAVQIWFQNKRQALRKQSATDREVTELPQTPVPVKIVHHMVQPFAPTPVRASERTSSPDHAGHSHNSSFSSFSNSMVHSTSSSAVSSGSSSRFYTTPNSLFIHQDDSFDSSIGLVLNETKKRQPSSLNGSSATTMTFKLGPARPSTTNILASINDDDLPRKRKPLASLDANADAPQKLKKESDGAIESLLHMKSGKWSQKVNV